ncbi:Olfactory receptor 2C3 Olfactory receptor 2C4 Olfactory receptor 2C5 Olfactory receptor OR1-30 [Channa argus]|uniref:Olfactory receptor 2C3 Olfactory receptor 2C4 Olfactory receptor 2C5 Olfactory receptor OR1-30 n=1 Tax=Channa argus TaxID=215402 RepID=A0A6G1PY15_CHAAH|nr:Olfactory receptor 2C3 Olfactory receptor 2C4 Olfactory receptor 2C5 Olfactory receptor OR1-30 [Channa argus]
MDNVTVITMLTLSGLNGTANYRVTLFAVTVLCYCVILLVNVTIIATIIGDKSLHEPMYIFLCNLCINGLYGTAGFYPKFLHDLLSPTQVISHAGCLLQGYVLHSSAIADFSLLALMAYDRYVAICRPLMYHSVMTKQRISLFVVFAWFVPFSLMLMSTIISTSRLCGSNIPKIYCVNWFINSLACSVSIATNVITGFNLTFYFGHAVFVVWTYIYMIKICLKSKDDMNKFMQTCLPHVFCVTIFTVCLLFDLLYMRIGSKDLSQSVQNFMAIEFLVIPPIINPLIYGFKLTKIRKRIQDIICGKCFRPNL